MMRPTRSSPRTSTSPSSSWRPPSGQPRPTTSKWWPPSWGPRRARSPIRCLSKCEIVLKHGLYLFIFILQNSQRLQDGGHPPGGDGGHQGRGQGSPGLPPPHGRPPGPHRRRHTPWLPRQAGRPGRQPGRGPHLRGPPPGRPPLWSSVHGKETFELFYCKRISHASTQRNFVCSKPTSIN